MTDDAIFLLLVPVAIVALLILFAWGRYRAEVIIRRWAARQDLKVLGLEELAVTVYTGAYRKREPTHRIVVEGPDGTQRTGRVHVTGLWADQIVLEWDE
jgi:hypothetical protein